LKEIYNTKTVLDYKKENYNLIVTKYKELEKKYNEPLKKINGITQNNNMKKY
jgi:hypothetical protein